MDPLTAIFNVCKLLGGLAVFMYGMKIMGDSLERVAGNNMIKLLSKVSNNRFSGVGVGLGVTAIMQSSSALTVMLVGFVNIGVMTLTQATAIIMGSNIGSTLTLQITSLKAYFDVTAVVSLFAVFGLFLNMFSKKNTLQRVGIILVGLGMIFIGLDFMGTSVESFQEPLKGFFTMIDNPFLLILFGAVFTGIIQSSAAATIIVANFAMQGAISVESALFAVMGMNIGTCVTALLACIGTSVNARRTAIIHLVFNIIGTVIVTALFFIVGAGNVMSLIYAVSGSGAEYAIRQIANFHTLFNIFTTILLLPFVKQLVTLSKFLIRGKDPKENAFHLKYVDERVLTTPPVAVSQMKKEVLNMAELAKSNLDIAFDAILSGSLAKDPELVKREEEVNFLNKAITGFLVRISSLDIGYKDELIIGSYFNVVTDIERLGDHAVNIMEFARRCQAENIKFSDGAAADIQRYERLLGDLYAEAMNVFTRLQVSGMALVNQYEDRSDRLKESMSNAHIDRLNKKECSPESGAVYLGLAGNFERIADHLTNVAESILSYVKVEE
jgi:phosphate:Na+ symporter